MSKIWAIIGGGNGGQAIAGHLSILGEKVRLFDVVQATVDAINEKGGIQLHHAVEGFGKLEFATTSMEQVLDGAEIVMMVLPSLHHEAMARQMVPFLKDGMTPSIGKYVEAMDAISDQDGTAARDLMHMHLNRRFKLMSGTEE